MCIFCPIILYSSIVAVLAGSVKVKLKIPVIDGFDIGNIFKVLRLDCIWRGNYRNLPDTNNFIIKGLFGFCF